jgi:hypothetical protein
VGVQGVVHNTPEVDGFTPEVDGFSMVESSMAAGQGQKRIDELRLVLAGVHGLLAGGPERAERDGGARQGYLEQGLAQHQRGAQFVGGVVDEASLGLERCF